MISRRSSFLAPLAIAALAVSAAGCGGGGASTADYAETYQGACQKVTKEEQGFQASSQKIGQQAAKDPSGAVASFKSGATKLFDTLGTQIQVLADAKAPDQFSDFQKSVAKDAKTTKAGIEKAKQAVAEISKLEDLGTIGPKLNAIKFGSSSTKLPADLAKKAPACKILDQS